MAVEEALRPISYGLRQHLPNVVCFATCSSEGKLVGAKLQRIIKVEK